MRASEFDPELNEVIQTTARFAGKLAGAGFSALRKGSKEKNLLKKRNKQLAYVMSPQGGKKALENWLDAIGKDWKTYTAATREIANMEGLSRFVIDEYNEMGVSIASVPQILKAYARGVNFPINDANDPNDISAFEPDQIKAFFQAFARYFVSNKRVRFAAAQYHPHTQEYLDELSGSKWLDRNDGGAEPSSRASNRNPGGPAGQGATITGQDVVNYLGLAQVNFRPVYNIAQTHSRSPEQALQQAQRDISASDRDRFLTYFVADKMAGQASPATLGKSNNVSETERDDILNRLNVSRTDLSNIHAIARTHTDANSLYTAITNHGTDELRFKLLVYFLLVYATQASQGSFP